MRRVARWNQGSACSKTRGRRSRGSPQHAAHQPRGPLLQPGPERQRDRHTDDEEEEREDHVGRGEPAPLRVPERPVDGRPRAGIVHQHHRGHREAAEHVYRDDAGEMPRAGRPAARSQIDRPASTMSVAPVTNEDSSQGQEQDRVRHLARLRPAAQQVVPCPPRRAARSPIRPGPRPGVCGTGVMVPPGHTALTRTRCGASSTASAPGEAEHRGLGGVVLTHAGATHQPVQRGNVDDGAAPGAP